jgi:hypothetical protein
MERDSYWWNRTKSSLIAISTPETGIRRPTNAKSEKRKLINSQVPEPNLALISHTEEARISACSVYARFTNEFAIIGKREINNYL